MHISIICPVYNKEPYIRQCIDSVWHQSFLDWELILVDDESPDNCPRICDEYAAQDSRIKVIHQKNKGHSEARNVGIRAARGDFIMFLDADDFFPDSEVLSEMYNHIISNNLDVCLSKISTLGLDGTIKESTFKHLNLDYNKLSGKEVLCEMINKRHYHATMCSRLFKSSLINDNGLYFKRLICDDEEWTPQIFYHASRVGFLDKDCYVIRKINDSVTGSSDVNTYKRKIKDRSVTSAMLMDCFEKFDLTTDQKTVLYDKYFSFFQMAVYSYLNDLKNEPKEDIKAHLLAQYSLVKKYRGLFSFKKRIKLIACRLALVFK